MAIEFSLNGCSITVDSSNSSKASMKNKRNKGCSLLTIPKDYIVIDLETTGLNPSFDEIIEVACVHFADGKEVDNFHSYVQPEPFDEDGKTVYVDDFITELTGITNEMLQNAPKFKDIARPLFNYLDGAFIVGHNVNFDINFLYDNFISTIGKEFSNDYMDTMRLARIVLPDLQHHRLKDLCKVFNITETQHRAMNDCKITQEILSQLLSIVEDKQIDLSIHKAYHKVSLASLKSNVSLNDKTHPFYGKHCVFTGTLKKFLRKDAAQIVCNIGGICDDNVTKKTNFLIIGGLEDNPLVKDGKSGKMKKAESLILKGQDLQIISEETFYDLLSDYIEE